MHSCPPDLYNDFIAHSREFALTADEATFGSVFPGHVVNPGDCLYPVHVRVKESFSAFRLTAGKEAPASLCFSKMMFVGIVDGVEDVQVVSKLGTCTQSSAYGHFRGDKVGLWGEVYTNNVHTEKEDGPWWRVEFPENVRVRHIYFFRRVDWAVINEDHLRIVGEKNGSDTVLYYPAGGGDHQAVIAENIAQAAGALKALRSEVPSGEQAQYDDKVSGAFGDLRACMSDAVQEMPKAEGALKRGMNALMRKPQAKVVNSEVGLPQRQVIADRLLDAVYHAIGGAKDFGCTPEDGLHVTGLKVTVKELRFRVYGEVPPGLAGAELFVADSDEPIAISRKRLELTYRPPGFRFPESYGLGLTTQLRSRVVKLDEPIDLTAIKVWNLNQQHAANTLFLEISGRASEDDDWQILHDQGGPFRHAISVFRLADYLIRSAWTPSYTRLMGKLFAQYRRRRVMRPIAKLVRDNAELNKALFEGAKTIPPQTRHAAPLVLGKHGLNVPVAFRPLKEVMAHLVEIRDKVRATGHTPMFMYGTLLGAIREKDFIPHDDDLDLAVIIDGAGPDDLMAECDKLIEVLNEAGVPCKSGSAIAPLIHCHRGPVTIDIFVLGHKDDTVYWPHTALKIVPERADIFLPAGTIEFKGETFDAPADPEAVSEARYGADWHIPNPAFEF